jgi:hypothetical protein
VPEIFEIIKRYRHEIDRHENSQNSQNKKRWLDFTFGHLEKPPHVIPAKAGIQWSCAKSAVTTRLFWIPAFAGMTFTIEKRGFSKCPFVFLRFFAAMNRGY